MATDTCRGYTNDTPSDLPGMKLAVSYAPYVTPLAAPTDNAITDPHGRGEQGLLSCPFCPDALNNSTSPFDHILATGPSIQLLPAVGMLVPGYFLVTTSGHSLSMAQLGPRRLKAAITWLTTLTGQLSTIFGNYMFFEHGSCAGASSGACIDHAHIHLLPLADDLLPVVETAAPWGPEFTDYASIYQLANENYAYLGTSGRHRVLRNPNLGSQWIRRIVASHIGTDLWDWAIDDGRSALHTTMRRIEQLLV